MMKLLGIVVAGLLAGAGGMALAHDMAGMPGMSQPVEQVAAAEPNTITIDNFTFAPTTLTVAPGTTVTAFRKA